MKPRHIWVIDEYAGSPYHGMEYRHYYLARHLLKYNVTTTIISASYSHLFKNLPKSSGLFTFENIDGIQYVWVKVPHYKTSQSKKRILKWFIYTLRLFFLPVKKLQKPDYIILSPMQTMPILPALFLKKRMKCPLSFEIKDIWPLSIIELGGYSPKHPFILWLSWLEKLSLQKCDPIISVLPSYQEYLNQRGIKKTFVYIPNGVEININQTTELPPTLLEKIPHGKFLITYTGTLGLANAIESFILAAENFRNHPNIYFLLVGDGAEKQALEKLANQNPNVIFTGAVEKKYIYPILQLSSVAFIGLKKKNLFYYGVSPNKLFDYMLAKKPIIIAINTNISLIDEAQCGITVPAEDSVAIAQAINKLFQMEPSELKKMGENGYQFVLKHHNYDSLALKLIQTLFDKN